MASSVSTIQVAGLRKGEIAVLRKQARTLGMSTESYAKRLTVDGISLEHYARTKIFDELLAPVRSRFRNSGMTDEELDVLVDKARSSHHRRAMRKKS